MICLLLERAWLNGGVLWVECEVSMESCFLWRNGILISCISGGIVVSKSWSCTLNRIVLSSIGRLSSGGVSGDVVFGL